jgi:hypothetical protein
LPPLKNPSAADIRPEDETAEGRDRPPGADAAVAMARLTMWESLMFVNWAFTGIGWDLFTFRAPAQAKARSGDWEYPI